MKKRFQLYYKEAAGKIEMYVLCHQYHMSGSVQYARNNEMVVELYGEEKEIDSFMSVVEQYLHRQPSKMVEVKGEPDYGRGDFRIG